MKNAYKINLHSNQLLTNLYLKACTNLYEVLTCQQGTLHGNEVSPWQRQGMWEYTRSNKGHNHRVNRFENTLRKAHWFLASVRWKSIDSTGNYHYVNTHTIQKLSLCKHLNNSKSKLSLFICRLGICYQTQSLSTKMQNMVLLEDFNQLLTGKNKQILSHIWLQTKRASSIEEWDQIMSDIISSNRSIPLRPSLMIM